MQARVYRYTTHTTSDQSDIPKFILHAYIDQIVITITDTMDAEYDRDFNPITHNHLVHIKNVDIPIRVVMHVYELLVAKKRMRNATSNILEMIEFQRQSLT